MIQRPAHVHLAVLGGQLEAARGSRPTRCGRARTTIDGVGQRRAAAAVDQGGPDQGDTVRRRVPAGRDVAAIASRSTAIARE